MIRRTMLALSVVAVSLWVSPVSADEPKAGTHEGKVVKVEGGKLTMTDKDGKEKHTHTIPADAQVTCDGKACKLEDLKAGAQVKVTAEKKGDKVTITKIEAKTAGS